MENGKILGYITFSHPDDAAGKRNLEINFIYVSPKYRRRGIATQMLDWLIKKFENKVIWISLWTGVDIEKNTAHNLYKKLGFKELAYQADYYQKGIGARLFTKRLKK